MTTTLLAVDDSKTMRKVLEITFAGESEYRVVTASNTVEAMTALRSEGPALVLADAGLGEESGYDLCQRVKTEAPGTFVVILSSKQAPYDNAKGSAAGADDHMDKPFDTQQMLDRVAGLIRRAPAIAAAPPAAAPPQPRAVTPAPQPRAATPAPQPRVVTPAPQQVAPAPKRQPTLSYGTPAVTPPSPTTAAAAPHQEALPKPAPQAASPAAPPAAPAGAGGNGDLAAQLAGLGLTGDQVQGVLALSREVVEQVVWEVVPVLAETIIQEEIRRLTSE